MQRRSVLALGAGGVAALALVGRATPAPTPGYLGAFAWQMNDPRFGGFSAIHVAEGGTRFVAISDRGYYTAGRLSRDADGRIAAVSAAPLRPLLSARGVPLTPFRSDAEGIAVGPGGIVHVSFEGSVSTRVLRYPDGIDGPAVVLPIPPAFLALGLNTALEALAVAPDGTLYTLPEVPGADSLFPVWRFRGGAWDQPFGLPAEGGFRAVAADIGADGALYLLERDFAGLAGFAMRLRRFALTDAGPTGERTLIRTEAGRHDNLEGLSVWRGPNGLVATMVSDDNFRFFQRTEIVEYLLPD